VVKVATELRGEGKDSHHRKGQVILRDGHLATAGRKRSRRLNRVRARHLTLNRAVLRGR